MPKVPGNADPSTLEAQTGGMWQPDPTHLMMAASDMQAQGRLLDPADQSPSKVGGNSRILKPRKRKR